MPRPAFLLVLFLLLAWADSSRAAVSVSLPLHGYYRPGRYMPVRLAGTAGETAVLSAPAAVPVRWEAGAGAAVAPMLLLTAAADRLSVTGAEPIPLIPLADDERLVATTLAGTPLPSLFPDARRVLTVPLDPVPTPLPGPPAAWTTLDAVALDAEDYRGLPPTTVDLLLSAGVTVAVWSDPAPDPLRPWQRDGNWWVLGHDLRGPGGAFIGESAYEPAQGWRPAWPPPIRLRILLAAGLLISLVLVPVLIGGRRGTWAACALAAAAVGGMLAWREIRPPVFALQGEVRVQHLATLQRDVWSYQSARAEAAGAYPFDALTYPVLPDAAHADRIGLQLPVAPDGRPLGFTYKLPARTSIAFLTRSIAPVAGVPSQPPTATPTPIRTGVAAATTSRAIAERLYLLPGDALGLQDDAALLKPSDLRPSVPTLP